MARLHLHHWLLAGLSWLLAGLVLAGPLSGLGSAAPVQPNGVATAAVDEAALASLMALRGELQRAEAQLAPLHQRRAALEADAVRMAGGIDELKRLPAGVRRDLDLQTALSASKSKTDELERVQAELRWREPGLAALRRRVVRVIDNLLDASTVSGRAPLPEASRLELERLRTATVALLVSPAFPLQVASDKDSALADPLDGPRELREKADLLRDSGDKLRREARRLAGRIDGVERRRRLRERANALDEDMFGEATSSRRITRTGGSALAGASSRGANDQANAEGSPSVPAPPGGTDSIPSPNFGSDSPTMGSPTNGPGIGSSPRTAEATVLRNLVDPATLAELRRADAIDDVDRQTRALKKAQAELETLAAELERRAKALDGRAEAIKRQK